MRILTLLLSAFLLVGCVVQDRKDIHDHFRNFLNTCDTRKGVKLFFLDSYSSHFDDGPRLQCNDGSYFTFKNYLQQLPNKE